jgi:bifunctional isochorismate lyase/aryl carrier protein
MQKEQYFTPGTIQARSIALLASVADSRRRHTDISFQPDSAALLVLDLQGYFLEERSHAFVPSAPVILPGIFKLIAAFLNAGYPVIATRHLNTREDAGMMSKWWRDIINSQTAYSQNIIFPYPSKINFINKPQYDAFLHTTLEDTLHKQGIRQVVICGVMTHLCCETTARSAFMRGFEVFFTIDGTATYNEQLHRASLLTLSHGFAVPVLIDELLCHMESDET